MSARKASNTRTQPVSPALDTPTAAAPIPDFRTIQVIFRTAEYGQQAPRAVVQNFICTDQSPSHALASLTGYYQESELLAAPKTLDLLVDAGRDDDFAFVYFSPAGVQVVMEMDTWAGLCQINGNSMMAAADFLNLSCAQLLAAKDPNEPFVKIHRMDFALGSATEAVSEEA